MNNSNNPLSRIQVNRNYVDTSSAARRARRDRFEQEEEQEAFNASEELREAEEAAARGERAIPPEDLAIHSINQIMTELQEAFPQYSFAHLQTIVNNYINNNPQSTRFDAFRGIAEQLILRFAAARNARKSRKSRKSRKNRRASTRRNRF